MPAIHHIWLGRDRELAELTTGLDDLAAGRGGLFLVRGEPGIGKTRLSDELARTATARGVAVHWGRAWEAGGAPSYWPFIQLLRGICRGLAPDLLATFVGPHGDALAELLPELRQRLAVAPGGGLDRFQLFEAVDAFLHAASAHAPLLVILDDLHAADPSSLQLLHFLVRDLRSRALLVLGTYREAEVRLASELAQTMARIEREAVVVPLRRLDRDEVARYVAEATGATPSAEHALALFHRTEGNPLFLRELLQLGAGATQPEGIREVVRARLALLGPDVRRVLEAAAVVGREIPLDVIEHLAIDVRTQLAHAAAAGIVEPVEVGSGTSLPLGSGRDRWRFTHVLLREGLHDDLPADRRAALHRDVAHALARRPGDAPLAELAHHLLLAVPAVPVGEAVDAVLRAATHSMTLLAFEDAAMLLARTAKLPEIDDRRRFEVELALGIARIRAGEIKLGKHICGGAAQLARGLGDGELLARAVLGSCCEYIPGLHDHALIAALEEALAVLPPGDGVLRALAMVQLAAERQPALDPAGPIALAREALAMARRLGDHETLRVVLSHAGLVNMVFLPVAERLLVDQETLRLNLEANDTIGITRGNLLLMGDCWELGDLTGAMVHARAFESLAMLRYRGYNWVVGGMHALYALWEGRFDDAARSARQVIDTWRRDEAHALELVPFECAWWRASEQPVDLPAIEIALRAEYAAAESSLWTLVCELLIAQMYARAGDRHRLTTQLAAIKVSPTFAELRAAVWLSLLAEPCLVAGDRELAARIYPVLAPFAGSFFQLSAYGLVHEPPYTRQLGLLAQTLGRLDDAIAHLDDAEARTTHAGYPSHLARLRYELAGALLARGGAGDRERAVRLLADARSLAERLGQVQLLPLLDARAQAAGVEAAPIVTAVAPPAPAAVEFALVREGDFFAITSRGTTIRLRDSRGLQLLAQLVASPNQECHVLQLVSGSEDIDRGDSGTLLDAEAIQQYRRRLLDLREDLEEAEDRNDLGRAERIRDEIESLTGELARAVGLGGRARRAGNAAERARTSVQKRVREAIKRIGDGLPELGKHLDLCVRTGTFCGYLPDSTRRR